MAAVVAEAAMVAERTRLEASSVSQLHDQKLEGMAAVKKAQQAESQAQKEVDEVRAALASAAGDEAEVLAERLKALSEAAEAAQQAVEAARRQASLRSMRHVVKLWDQSQLWRMMVQWRVGMVGEEQGAAEKVNKAANVSVSGDEAAAMRPHVRARRLCTLTHHCAPPGSTHRAREVCGASRALDTPQGMIDSARPC